MKSVTLKKALGLFGATDVVIKNSYNERSGFFNKDNQLYYFATTDLRDTPVNILTRTAKSRADYTGGTNKWELVPYIENLGMKIVIPFLKYDSNGQ